MADRGWLIRRVGSGRSSGILGEQGCTLGEIIPRPEVRDLSYFGTAITSGSNCEVPAMCTSPQTSHVNSGLRGGYLRGGHHLARYNNRC
jgi:hypothetical protein